MTQPPATIGMLVAATPELNPDALADLYEALAALDEQLLFDKPVYGTGKIAFAKARAALSKAKLREDGQ